MNDLTTKMGIREVLSQAQYAEVTFGNVFVKGSNSTIIAFSSIHSFLTHSAMLSKLLWSKDLVDKSGETLAEILNIPDGLKIKDRKFRNVLEHYDEHLKKWIDSKGNNSIILDNNIGSRNAIKLRNAVWIRHYDPATDIFTLIGDDLNLADLHEEVTMIKDKATEWLAKNTEKNYDF